MLIKMINNMNDLVHTIQNQVQQNIVFKNIGTINLKKQTN